MVPTLMPLATSSDIFRVPTMFQILSWLLRIHGEQRKQSPSPHVAYILVEGPFLRASCIYLSVLGRPSGIRNILPLKAVGILRKPSLPVRTELEAGRGSYMAQSSKASVSKLSVESQRVNILDSVGHLVSVTIMPLYHGRTKTAKGDTYRNTHVYALLRLHLQTVKFKFHIILVCC